MDTRRATRKSTRVGLGLALAVVVVCSALLPVLTANAGPTPPSPAPTVRLLAPTTETLYQRFDVNDPPEFSAGLRASAYYGNYEVRVKRTSYGAPITASVWVDGKKVKGLGDTLLDGFRGFKDAVELHVTDSNGNTVKDESIDWCPNGSRLRLNDKGPAARIYPDSCIQFSPWAKGAVWGIERAWATSLSQFDPTAPTDPPGPRILDGLYTVTAKFSAPIATALGFTRAAVISKLRVRTLSAAAAAAGARASAAATPDAQATAAAIKHVNASASATPVGPENHNRVSAAAVPTMNAPDRNTTPDLAALPAWGMGINYNDGREYLTFGATVWNAGPSALIVEGFRRPNSSIMDAYEYFTRYGKRIGQKKVGTMEYDPRVGHMHWHFHDFATYDLLDANQQNPVRSGKEAFCLANTDAIDMLVHNAKWRLNFDDLGSVCGDVNSTFVREAMSVGYGDTYSQARPGQAFDITDLPNGTYYIRITANPLGRLAEYSSTNNQSIRQVILHGTRGNRTVEVPLYNGIDTESGFRLF
jgi:hypothetical protein